MATNKNQVPIINEESIEKALKCFKSAYKEKKEHYEEENIKIEDVVSLTRNFYGKSAVFAATIILTIMIAMPPKEFIALMDTAKSISKAKFLEAIKEFHKENVEDVDNNFNK